jgi:hypothetical protein
VDPRRQVAAQAHQTSPFAVAEMTLGLIGASALTITFGHIARCQILKTEQG